MCSDVQKFLECMEFVSQTPILDVSRYSSRVTIIGGNYNALYNVKVIR